MANDVHVMTLNGEMTQPYPAYCGLYTMYIYSRPSILRPPMGPRKRGLILQVVLK